MPSLWPSPPSSTRRCTGSSPGAADGQARRGRLFAVAGILYLVSLGFTTLGLVVAQWVAPSALVAELVALTVANALAAVFRFAVLRAWIFRPNARASAGPMEVSR